MRFRSLATWYRRGRPILPGDVSDIESRDRSKRNWNENFNMNDEAIVTSHTLTAVTDCKQTLRKTKPWTHLSEIIPTGSLRKNFCGC